VAMFFRGDTYRDWLRRDESTAKLPIAIRRLVKLHARLSVAQRAPTIFTRGFRPARAERNSTG
jgi:hypothetical protein